MNTLLFSRTDSWKTGMDLLPAPGLVKHFNYFFVLLAALFTFLSQQSNAQVTGKWTAVKQNSPDAYGGQMLLLTDGTVIIKSQAGGGDGVGNVWEKLTPDIHGSYVNGTWSKDIAPMHYTRLDFSSQVLKDGRIYVAGGEYGTGNPNSETYDPLTNVWTMCPSIGSGQKFVDANSEILEDGRVLQAVVLGNLKTIFIYDPVKNTYVSGPSSIGMHNESTWIKLPDYSILQVDRSSKTSERYFQFQNKWIADGTVPVDIYDPFGSETGPGFLLPDGRVFHLSSLGTNAFYTPTGTTSPGTWQAAAVTPNNLGTPDAPGAMMVDGKILCMVSPLPTKANVFPHPCSFYEFDYLTNSFTSISTPTGGVTVDIPSYVGNMLALPDGTILYGQQASSKYYTYTPAGAPLAAGKPKIGKINVTSNSGACTYTITGTGFNGISEGAVYGDDEQMATNYPIIRLTSGTNVYYARTFNWNSTGVMRGNKPDTTQFTLPAGLSNTTTYQLVVTVNGIASDPVSFIPCVGIVTGIEEITHSDYNSISVYPNPANELATVTFNVKEEGNYTLKIIDMIGKTIAEETGKAVAGDNSQLLHLNGIAKGVYTVSITQRDNIYITKMLVK